MSINSSSVSKFSSTQTGTVRLDAEGRQLFPRDGNLSSHANGALSDPTSKNLKLISAVLIAIRTLNLR